MNPGHTVTITPADVHVVVRVDGETVAETHHPVILDETGLPTRYYLRREDVRMDLLRTTNFKTECPFKGQASYWTLVLGDAVHDGRIKPRLRELRARPTGDPTIRRAVRMTGAGRRARGSWS